MLNQSIQNLTIPYTVNPYSLLPLASCMISLLYAAYMLFIGYKYELYRRFFIVCFAAAFWFFGEFMVKNSPTETLASYWNLVTIIGWLPFPSYYLHFVLLLVGSEGLKKKKTLYYCLLYLPPLIMIILNLSYNFIFVGMERTAYGWIASVQSGKLGFLSPVHVAIYLILIQVVLIRYYLKEKQKVKKKQILIVLVSNSISFIIAILTECVPPWIGIRALNLASVGFAILLVSVSFAIIRYGFLLTPDVVLSTVKEVLPDAFIVLNEKREIVSVNNEVLKLLGYIEENLITKEINNLIFNFDEQSFSQGYETYCIAKEGNSIPVMVSGTYVYDKDGDILGLIIVMRDISRLKEVMSELEEARNNLEITVKERTRELEEARDYIENVVNSMIDILFVVNRPGNFISVNKSACKMFGLERESLIGKNIYDFFVEKEHLQRLIEEIEGPGIVMHEDMTCRSGSNALIPVILSMASLRDNENNPVGIVGVAKDITELKKAQKALRESLLEKEVLLKEIHHRVKNNLQIISSIVNLQRRRMKDEETIECLLDTTNRVKTIALIHEKLYQSDSLALVDFSLYVNSLISDIIKTYGRKVDNISFKIDIEKIELDLSKAIPCALITNELISNAVKYAFPDRSKEENRITVSFKSVIEKGIYMLIVTDNGVGLPADFNIASTSSLGLKIVNILASQLDGNVILETGRETGFRIEFNMKNNKTNLEE